MILVTCPTCGNHMGELPEPDKVRNSIPDYLVAAFDAILGAGVDGISTIDLSIKLHGEKLGTEESSMKRAAVYASALRRRIDRFGYCIPKNKTQTSGVYRIIPAGEAA